MRTLLTCVLLSAACSVPPLPQKECPCAEGFECIANVCVDPETLDAGTDSDPDASLDAAVDARLDAVPDSDVDAPVDAVPDGDAQPDASDDRSFCERHTDALLCEDFDDVSEWTRDTRGENTTIEIDATTFEDEAEHERVLQVSIDSPEARGFLTTPLEFEGSRVFTRADIFIPDEEVSYINPYAVRNTNNQGLHVAIENNRSRIFVNNRVQKNGLNVPKGQWFCVTTVAISGVSVSLSVDAAPHMTLTNTEISVDYDVALVGAELSRNQQPITYWIDNFVVSESRLDCD